MLTSILGDRLAKTGDEAGNSLKTLMSYLTRDKTINLFNKLSLDADGLTSSLMKTETQFEEFRVIMSTVSDAYNSAMERGDEVTARAIQQAIGATRQGDAAIALLKNWNEDYAKYTAMLNTVPFSLVEDIDMTPTEWTAIEFMIVEDNNLV